MGGCNDPSDGQTEPVAALLGFARFVAAVKTVENFSQILGGDARTRVLYAQDAGVSVVLHAQRNASALGRIFDGIVQQDPHQLLHHALVPVNHGVVGGGQGKGMLG